MSPKKTMGCDMGGRCVGLVAGEEQEVVLRCAETSVQIDKRCGNRDRKVAA